MGDAPNGARLVPFTLRRPCCWRRASFALLALVLGLFGRQAVGQSLSERVAPTAGREARNWVVTPSLRVVETYTDNVFLSPDTLRQSDWITQFIPGIAVTGNGPRIRLDAFYAPEIAYHVETERNDKVFHRGNAVGTLELADELLFVDAGARVDQYDVSVQGPLTTSNVSISGNRATAATTYVSPYLLRNIGSAARAEARFTYSTWESDEEFGALPDNTGRRVDLRLTNSPMFRALTWDLAYSSESIKYETQQETTSQEFTASAQRRMTRALSLLALAGYERYDTGNEVLADPRWSGGFEWTPVPRTRLAMTAGQRLDEETYSFQFSHRTRLTTWDVSYAEDVTTSREQFFSPATQSAAVALDRMFLSQYPDPSLRRKAIQDFMSRIGMGLPPSLCSISSLSSDQLFLQKRWLASVGLQGIRNTVVATACWESSELLGNTGALAGDFAVSRSIRKNGASLAWALRLTARNTWNAEAGYTRSHLLDSGQENDFVYLRAGLTRQFQPRVSGSLYYRLQDQNAREGGAEYREHAGIASLLMTF